MKFKEGGVTWFVTESYKYIEPIGFRAHVAFLIELPGALWMYMKEKRNDD